MNYLIFGKPKDTYKIAILVRDLNKYEIEKEYLNKLDLDDVIVYELFSEGKKTKKVRRVEYLQSLLPILADLSVEHILVGDSEYFKDLSGLTKTENTLGYSVEFDKRFNNPPHKLMYIPNYRQVFYDPVKVRNRIDLVITSLISIMNGEYVELGSDIIKFSEYPRTVPEIKAWLDKLCLLDMPLSADIEAYSLKHYSAGIGTISFAWSQGEGIAFPVDYRESHEEAQEIRKALSEFFIKFNNKIIWHNASYDIYVLIYQLYMEHIEDYEGLLNGLEILTKNFDDTKILAYLALNSCAGNELGLKALSHEYSGDYSEDGIDDILKISLDQLLRYNLVDTVSTWYVYNKYNSKVDEDNQRDIYNNIFKPGLVDIIQMQLSGMPMCMDKIQETKKLLMDEVDIVTNILNNNKDVQKFEHLRKEKWVTDRNNTLKVKRVTISDCKEKDYKLNPGSSNQLGTLLHEVLPLPVVDKTDTGLPSTGAKTLEKLKNHTKDSSILEILDALIRYAEVAIILSTFIPAFEKSVQGPSGQYYLFGYFNLGGTVSGRLSSNGPNLQNIPANSKYAGPIKECFVSQHPWLFCGLDFNSLEDKISALTTKDPNKLTEYIEGYDGHCLRSFVYFGEQMPDIIEGNVDSINSIKSKYKDLRQASKDPTFALTYQGTYFTLMNNCGFSKEKAQMVEQRYRELYKVSIQYIDSKLEEATSTGYVTGAFGLRVRTPLLAQVIRSNSATPREAQAEGRTAGNALGQSYGLLNTRASSAFMAKVRKHPEYRLLIRPCAHIHDAQYYRIYEDINLIKWVNDNLVKESFWQDDPNIYHDVVKLGGELSLFYPSWAEEITLDNNLEIDEIQKTITKQVTKMKEGKQK